MADLRIHKVHVELTDQQTALLKKKLTKLDRFRNYIQGMDLYIKQAHARKDGKSLEMELKILVPGNTLVVRERAGTVEEAIDLVLRTAQRQLKKFKETHR